MKTRVNADTIELPSRRSLFARLASRLARAAGRRQGLRNNDVRGTQWVESLEARVMLDGLDHPSFPVPFNPAIGTVVTLTNMPGSKEDGRGKVQGNLATSSGDDAFRFTMPGAMGSQDFVSVLVDTIMRADDTTPWGAATPLDSYVEVYNSSGQLISFGANNGVISSTSPNPTPDAWTGFVGTAGQTYTIRVRSEQGALAAGRTRVGDYTLRIDAATQAITVDTTFVANPGKGADTFGEGLVADLTGFRQDEIVYKVTTPNDTRFNSLATANLISEDTAIFDNHLSVYDAQGVQLADDQQAGRLTNAFSTFTAAPSSTFYFRVRGDELNAGRPAFGQFTLVVDLSALPLQLDPVTRVNMTRQDPLLGPTMNTPGTAAKMYQFRAEGNGLAFVTIRGTASPDMTPALQDAAVRIFNSNGVLIDFNDDFNGTTDSQLEVVLTGGETYYVLVEGFDRATNGAFTINIEAQHTYGPTVPVDDHEDGPNSATGNPSRLQFENATPIIFGAPRQYLNSDGNVIDHDWVQDGVGRGRIHDLGDTDLFQFTAPISQQGAYVGNDGDQGSALYLGGNFANATWGGTASGAHTIDAHNTAIWDAGRYYNAGPALEPDAALDGRINTMITWTPDGATSPILIAGGLFNIVDDMGMPQPANLAFRVFVPFNPLDAASPRWQWQALPTDGEVFALGVGDIIADTPGAELVVGGDFTDVGGVAVGSVIAIGSDGAGGLVPDDLDGGVSGGDATVKAIAFYDPPAAPDPDGAGMLTAPTDQPLGLYVGGNFTTADTATNVGNIARWGVIDSAAMPPTEGWQGLSERGYDGLNPDGIAGINEILALQVYNPPDGMTTTNPRLYAAGRTGGTNGFIRFWDPSILNDAWSNNIAAGGAGPVRALATWTPPISLDPTQTNFLLAGGGNATSGFVTFGTGDAFAPLLNGGANAAVRDILVRTDVEPAFASATSSVYVAGEFTEFVNFAGDTLAANGVVRFDFDFDGDWATLGGGVTNASPGAAPGDAVGVYALGDLDDDIGGVWDRMERSSSRVVINVAPNAEAFLNTEIVVYDSNFNIVYTNQTLSDTQDTPASGALDPAAPDAAFINLSPPTNINTTAPGLSVWGGEVYYIEVIGTSGTGRYTLSVTTEAVPPENPDNGDGAYQNEISSFVETPDGTLPDISGTPVLLDAGRAAGAPEIQIDGDGNARTFLDPTNAANPASYTTRSYDRTPAGIDRTEFYELPVIERVGDTDLYKFRAPASGYAEIRMATFGLRAGWQQVLTDNVAGTTVNTPRTKTLTSALDGALRIFNNDFEQIGYNDDNLASGGFLAQHIVDTDDGAFDPALRTFRHSDPRVVVPVEAGKSYFIQVESGQLLTHLNPDPAVNTLVDWRRAIGAYEVLISTTRSLNGIDDFSNRTGFNGTDSGDAAHIPIVDATGDGMVTGVIDDVVTGVFQNPDDSDLFRYIAPNRGQTFIRVIPTGTNSQLRLNVQVINSFDNTVVAQTATGPGLTAQIIAFPEQGDDWLISINGDAGSEGAYRIEIDGQGIIDDHADQQNWASATELTLIPFFGTATASGVIENADDTDVFKWTAETYETATVTVDGMSATLDPYIQVYEISSDIDDSTMGNPVFLQVSFNNDGPNVGTDSVATFATTPGRTYYFVVSGFDVFADRGNYEIEVAVEPTDDHPNFVEFPLATTLSLTFDALTQTATNTPPANGNIEKTSDDDLFRFTAPATGRASVTIATPAGAFSPAVRVFDQTGTQIVALTDGANGTVTVNIANITLNQQYYIQVLPGVASDVNETDLTGLYTVSVSTEPIDDHPDEGQFGSIGANDIITLNSSNGVGTRNGILVPDMGAEDTDLFRFTTLAGGSTLIRVTTTNSSLNPKIRVFNSSFVLIPGATTNGETATQTITSGGVGEVYYVLVEKNTGATGAAAVGNYQVSVSGQLPGGGGGGQGPDDHANAGEFNSSSIVNLDSKTGTGLATGVISYVGDTDLFRFTALNSGAVQMQLVTPIGGLVDGQIRIFNQSLVEIGSNSAGIPGATAAFNFTATLGQTYYILVEPVGSVQGSYELRLDTQPLNYFLYYPEGFASRRIDEFVPIVNPNNFAVNYSIFARYEVGDNADVPIFTGTIEANSRSGVTITTRKNFAGALVRPNTPYSLELRSDGPLGATFSHYDFNVSVGESFSRETSQVWTFANFTKSPAEFRDYLVLYNPNATSTDVTITLYYENGLTTSFTQTVTANRRSGVNINNDGRVPQNGRFGIKVESTQPIVAAQSSYNLLNSGGDGLLGDKKGGSIEGVVGGVSTGGGSSGRLALLNSGTEPVTAVVTASYARVDLPDVTRVIVVQPGRVFSQTLAEFGLTNSEVAGIRYTSNLPLTMNVIQYQNGDGDSPTTATEAASRFIFGDAFMNPRRAGITYLEDMTLYNPGNTSVDVTITYLFRNNAPSKSTVVTVGAGKFSFVSIDQDPNILSLTNTQPFSISVGANTPFVAFFTHYDRFLNGGWSALGAPIGLSNDLSTI